MDPFIESPWHFRGFRNRFVTYAEEALQPTLPEPYFAHSNERTWIDADNEQREAFLEIYSGHEDQRRLVTAIELLSPSNKSPVEHDRLHYVRRQREVLESEANLVEIDLLRGGEKTTAFAKQKAFEQAGLFDYHVSVFRFSSENPFFVYPIQLSVPLPIISVPLLLGDGDVPLDLQAVFNRCYDTGPYRKIVRYQTEVPDPPLSAEQLTWTKNVLSNRPA